MKPFKPWVWLFQFLEPKDLCQSQSGFQFLWHKYLLSKTLKIWNAKNIFQCQFFVVISLKPDPYTDMVQNYNFIIFISGLLPSSWYHKYHQIEISKYHHITIQLTYSIGPKPSALFHNKNWVHWLLSAPKVRVAQSSVRLIIDVY